MAIPDPVAVRQEASTTNANTYAITPFAVSLGRLYVAFVYVTNVNNAITAISISDSPELTWTPVAEVTVPLAARDRMRCWRAIASANGTYSTSVVPTSSSTPSGAQWHFIEIASGFDPTTPIGATATHTDNTTANAESVDLGAFAGGSSLALACAVKYAAEILVPDVGYEVVGAEVNMASPTRRSQVQYQSPGIDPVADWTWTGTAVHSMSIGLEIRPEVVLRTYKKNIHVHSQAVRRASRW